MKYPTIAAFVAAQLLATTQPAFAAELAENQTQQMGMFGGVRLRVPLDGGAESRPVRAGLTIAPTLQTRNLDGEIRTRIGEGLEVGHTGDAPLQVSLAGTPLSQLPRGPVGPEGQRLGVSNLGWIAIGAGTVIAGLGLAWIILDN